MSPLQNVFFPKDIGTMYRRDRKARGEAIMKNSALSAPALSLSKGSQRLVFSVDSEMKEVKQLRLVSSFQG